jgi:hypothetical protein
MIPPLTSATPLAGAPRGVPLKPFPSSSVLHDLGDKPLVAVNRVTKKTMLDASRSTTPGRATATASQLLFNQTVYFSKWGSPIPVKTEHSETRPVNFDDAVQAARELSRGRNSPVGVVDAGDGEYLLLPLHGDGANGRGQSKNSYPLGTPSRTEQDVTDQAAFEKFVRQYATSDAEARDSAERAWRGASEVLVQPAYDLVEPLHPAVKALVEPNGFADLRNYSGGSNNAPGA